MARDIAEALSMLVDKSAPNDVWDDDIDAPVDEEPFGKLEFELDEKGNYVRLYPHLLDMIPVGKAKPNVYQRAELFHETVIETIMDSWRKCRQMQTHLYAGFPYVGIVLDMNRPDIGGFTQKSKRDEQKGTIIECINAGRISTLITPGLSERHLFVFLPNASTLAAIGEFRLLTSGAFQICFVSARGDVQLTDLDISYNGVAGLILDDISAQDLIVSALEGYDPNLDLLDAPTMEEIKQMEAQEAEEAAAKMRAEQDSRMDVEQDDDFSDLEEEDHVPFEEENTDMVDAPAGTDESDFWDDDEEMEEDEDADLVGFEELSDEED